MPRFFINDSNRPGARLPRNDFRTKVSAQSDVLNEAQAIAQQRKNFITRPQGNSGAYWRVVADTTISNVGLANPKVWCVAELAMYDALNVPLSDVATPIASSWWSAATVPANLHNGLLSGVGSSWYSGTGSNGAGEWCGYQFPDWKVVKKIVLWNYTNAWYNVSQVTVQVSDDGVSWRAIKSFILPVTASAMNELNLP